MSEDFKRWIRDVPDFPKPGIVFKDITPLLRDAGAFSRLVDELARFCERRELRPDVCAGPEARGFVFAAALANRLGLGFVPIRKPGKLPAETRRIEYALEYGSDALEMHADAIEPGERVLLVDDVLATGGTIAACADLVARQDGKVCGLVFALELGFLGGRSRLDHPEVHSVISYA
jgi:adenine phosphoribosyltransferase